MCADHGGLSAYAERGVPLTVCGSGRFVNQIFMCEIRIYPSESRDEASVHGLCLVWERSVRATHTFLSDAEIGMISRCVPAFIRAVPHLIVAADAVGQAVAFMGISGRKIEMLFVDPALRRAGSGAEARGVRNPDVLGRRAVCERAESAGGRFLRAPRIPRLPPIGAGRTGQSLSYSLDGTQRRAALNDLLTNVRVRARLPARSKPAASWPDVRYVFEPVDTACRNGVRADTKREGAR